MLGGGFCNLLLLLFFDVSSEQGTWDFSASQRDRKSPCPPPGHRDPHWDLLSSLSPLACVCQQGETPAEVEGRGYLFSTLVWWVRSGLGCPLPLRLEAPPASWPPGPPGTTLHHLPLWLRWQDVGLLLDPGGRDTNEDPL